MGRDEGRTSVRPFVVGACPAGAVGPPTGYTGLMVIDPTDHRLSAIEKRLATLEALMGRPVQEERPPIVAISPPVMDTPPPMESHRIPAISASTILGWAGAAALLLA